jgi:hypothetical protein
VYHYESVILSVAIQEHRLGKDYHKVQMLEVSHQDALLITEKREQKVPQVKFPKLSKNKLKRIFCQSGTSHGYSNLLHRYN